MLYTRRDLGRMALAAPVAALVGPPARGEGQTPIREILRLMRHNRWTFPASVELEYRVPDGSDAVREVARCLDYCRAALA